MDGLILTIRLVLMITGLAVWAFGLGLLLITGVYFVKNWYGWQRVRDWWWLANGGDK